MFWKETFFFMPQDDELSVLPSSLEKFLISLSPLTSAYTHPYIKVLCF